MKNNDYFALLSAYKGRGNYKLTDNNEQKKYLLAHDYKLIFEGNYNEMFNYLDEHYSIKESMRIDGDQIVINYFSNFKFFSNLKSQLTDAPTEIKKSFNILVKYFDNKLSIDYIIDKINRLNDIDIDCYRFAYIIKSLIPTAKVRLYLADNNSFHFAVEVDGRYFEKNFTDLAKEITKFEFDLSLYNIINIESIITDEDNPKVYSKDNLGKYYLNKSVIDPEDKLLNKIRYYVN